MCQIWAAVFMWNHSPSTSLQPGSHLWNIDLCAPSFHPQRMCWCYHELLRPCLLASIHPLHPNPHPCPPSTKKSFNPTHRRPVIFLFWVTTDKGILCRPPNVLVIVGMDSVTRNVVINILVRLIRSIPLAYCALPWTKGNMNNYHQQNWHTNHTWCHKRTNMNYRLCFSLALIY